MRNSNEIKNEISKTETRLNELEAQRNEQAATFEVVQQSFVDGKADSDKLHAEQNKLTLLEQAVGSLKRTYERLKAAFSEQSAAERRREQIKQMARLANEIEIERGEYVDMRESVNSLIATSAARLVDKKTGYQTKQREYQGILRELGTLTGEEIQSANLSDEARALAGASYLNNTDGLEFDRAIVLIEQMVARKLSDAEQAERQAEFQIMTKAQRAGVVEHSRRA